MQDSNDPVWRRRAASLWSSPRLTSILWIFTIGAYMTGFHTNSDAYWMARAGAAVLGGSPLIGPDHWGWDAPPGDFIPVSPGWELALGVGARVAGARGVQITVALAMSLSVGAMLWVSRRLGATPGATLVSLALAALVPGTLAARASFPALALFMVAVTVTAERVRRRTRHQHVHLLLLAMAVSTIGIWLHASWCTLAVGLPVVSFVATRDAATTWRARLAASVATGSGALLGVLSGPAGASVWTLAAQVQATCTGLVSEWNPTLDMGLLGRGSALLLALTIGPLLLRSLVADQPWVRGMSTSTVLLLASAGSLLMGYFALRFVTQASLLAVPGLAAFLSDLVRRYPVHERGPTKAARLLPGSLDWKIVGNLTALVLLPAATITGAMQPLYAHPQLLDRLPADCRLFTDIHTANLTSLLRPDVYTWIDGRLHFWGRARIAASWDFLDGRTPSNPVPRGTTCVITTPGVGDGLANALSGDASWKVAARSDDAELWLPTAGTPAGVPGVPA